MERQNIDAFVQYFESGAKRGGSRAAGMELEHYVVRRKDGLPVSYGGACGVGQLLERMSGAWNGQVREEGYLVGLSRRQYALSLEPAAQLEISIMPYEEIRHTIACYEQFCRTIKPFLDAWDYELVCAGYLMAGLAGEQKLIPKRRYGFMDQYFAQGGSYGRYMMRGTASTQVSVDYSDEKDFVRIYRAAVSMSPLFALLTDNAPVFEGEKWNRHMVRTHIWSHVDKERCRIVPGTFESDFGFVRYAEYLYHVPQIFSRNENGTYAASKATLSELCAGKSITTQQIEHAMSIVFPDVRLKKYVELRAADSMPPLYAFAYLAFIKGLFSNHDKLFELYKQFEQYTQFKKMSQDDVYEGEKQLVSYGFQGIIYGKTAAWWLERMGELAYSQLPHEEHEYISPLLELIQEQKSVRDVISLRCV